jgi:hypothetical protein
MARKKVSTKKTSNKQKDNNMVDLPKKPTTIGKLVDSDVETPTKKKTTKIICSSPRQPTTVDAKVNLNEDVVDEKNSTTWEDDESENLLDAYATKTYDTGKTNPDTMEKEEIINSTDLYDSDDDKKLPALPKKQQQQK